jgi:exonuclease SbcC
MSSVIESLKIRNFEGYRDENLLFSAGLNLIKGRNSTGKSTILDAISFALFGEAPDVDKKLLVSKLPGENDIAAYVKFRSPKTGETIEVRREGKLDARGGYRNQRLELHIDGKEAPFEDDDDLRAKISILLGLSFRQFMNLVYVRQGRLTAILEPKAEQMDSILGITLLRELHTQFDDTRKCLEKYEGNDIPTEVIKLENVIIPNYEQQLADLGKEIPPLQDEVSRLSETVKKAESEECQSLLKQIEEKKEMDSRLQDLTTRTQQLLESAGAKTLDELRAKEHEYAKEHKSLTKEIEGQAKIRDELHGAWTSVKGRADSLEDEITSQEKLLKKGVTKCPNCGKTVSITEPGTERQADRKTINELKAKHNASVKQRDDLRTQIEDQANTRNQLQDLWTKVKGRTEALDEQITGHEKLLKKGVTTCPTCGQSISATKFKTQLQNDKTELTRLKIQTKQAKQKYDTAENTVSGLEDKSNDLDDTVEELADEIAEQEKLLKRGLTKCSCGQTISASKLKAQLQTDKAKLTELKRQTKLAKQKHDKMQATVSNLDDKSRNARDKAKSLKESAENITKYEVERKQIVQDLEMKLNEMRSTLISLGLLLDPQQPTFEISLGAQIPITQAELEKTRTELRTRTQLLKGKTGHEKEITEAKSREEIKLKALKLQLQKASLARQLSEGFEQAIEDRRREQIKNIALRGLQYYKSMTDQHTYVAISIDPETYRVYVHPKGLTDRIPATRTGGGHQTLISLALRLALLQELNFRSLLILDEPTYGVDDENLPQLANQLGLAAKQLSQTIIVTHHGICEEDATNMLIVRVGEDGVSRIEPTR